MNSLRAVMIGGLVLVLASSGAASAGAAAPPPAPPDPFVHPTDVGNPACVIELQRGDSLSDIAEEIPDTAVSYDDLALENDITDADRIEAGDYLDICVGNQLDDISGDTVDVNDVDDPEAAEQQRQLNTVFAGKELSELAVDGVSGPLTRQQLCTFRLLLGQPTSNTDMTPGSYEEQVLMSVSAVPPIQHLVTEDSRWIIIDQTCQIMLVGTGTELQYIFPTSTGEAGFETRIQQRSRAFRFDPALENDGWHNSTTFPAAADNPLNGNMYKPIYFDRGQAIHGSYNVPPEPLSKGCARLNVEDQDTLIAWLGLGDADSVVSSGDRINLRVTVQGQFVFPLGELTEPIESTEPPAG